MKKTNSCLKGASSPEKLEAGKREKINFFHKKTRGSRKKRYIIFIATALATVTSVLLLLGFGVGENGRPFLDGLRLSGVADKISAALSGLDFPLFTFEQKAPTSPDSQTPTTPGISQQKPPSIAEKEPSSGGTDGKQDIYDFDYSAVPDGHVPVVPMDLSLSSYGSLYINNLTGYTPDVSGLLNKKLSESEGYRPLSLSQSPLVLIVHTHGTEAYLDENTQYVPEGSDSSRSTDITRNVVLLGKTIADTLNRQGVPTAHCSIMHDSVQYRDSYARAEETIRKYLEEFPTIRLVIDVHRDSILRSNGEIVRPVVAYGDKTAAQLMCVVGSDWEGDDCPNWENNLSLALKFRERMNLVCKGICRPTFLKGHTYNQEIAPYSMLIEVGASGNSLSEALISAQLAGESLAVLLGEIF